MSQLGNMYSGNNLQRQKKGLWHLGEWKKRYMCLKEDEGEGVVYSRKRVPGERRQ